MALYYQRFWFNATVSEGIRNTYLRNNSNTKFNSNNMLVILVALTEPSIDYGFHRLGKLVPRHPGDPEKLPKEIVLKRAADLAEALYSMPRNNQLALTAAGSPRSPSAISASAQQAAAMHAGFNSYSGQLAVSVQENAVANGQWAEGK